MCCSCRDYNKSFPETFQTFFFQKCCCLREHIALLFICVFPCWTLLIWESFASVVMEVRVCVSVCACSWDTGRGGPYIDMLGIGSQLWRWGLIASYHSGCNVNLAARAAGVSAEQHGNSLPQDFPSGEVLRGQLVKGYTRRHSQGIFSCVKQRDKQSLRRILSRCV